MPRARSSIPTKLGADAYCESVYDPEAIALATRYVRQACFTGAITVELKRDPRDERPKFIKADCRFVRATRLSTALGLAAPSALYERFAGRSSPRARPARYRAGAKWLWLEAYVYTLWEKPPPWSGRARRPLSSSFILLAG